MRHNLLRKNILYKKKNIQILTADWATLLIGTVSATITTATSYRIRATSSVIASERTLSCGNPSAIPRPTSAPRLVAAISTRHYCIAEFVRRQTLAVVTSERSVRALWETNRNYCNKICRYSKKKISTLWVKLLFPLLGRCPLWSWVAERKTCSVIRFVMKYLRRDKNNTNATTKLS